MKEETKITCPHCNGTINLTEEPAYLNKVRRAFFAGRKGMGTLIMMFLAMLAIIILLAFGVGMRL